MPFKAGSMDTNIFSLKKLLIVSAAAISYLMIVILPFPSTMITRVYFIEQDIAVIAGAIVLFLAIALRPPSIKLKFVVPRGRNVWLFASALSLLLWAGTYGIMANYAITRDEHMVLFDGQIFSRLQLSQPLTPEWRSYAVGLVPSFLLDVPSHQILVSAYGPGNAMMRAAFGVLLDPSLMNPALAGIGLITLFYIAKKLFPQSPGAVWVCLLGYVLSSQILVNAMTTYAMTGHLALNLVWLALFLRNDRWGYFGTMVIGAWAIGLHQIVFHPLFAGPFILTLIPQKRWALFTTYAFVYAASLLFWIGYPTLVMDMAGISAPQGSGAGSTGFIKERIVPLLIERDPSTLALTHYNLLRYIAWSPLFMVPLLALAWPAIRHRERLALPLFCGAFLTLLAMIFLLPYQGHGWGYRYLHPVAGNLILLAGYGFTRWSAQDEVGARSGTAIMAGATATFALPFLLFTAYQMVQPQADLADLISRQQTDFVLLDTQSPSNAVDQTRNWADLSNRPLLFSSKDLTDAQIRELCARGSLTLIRRADFHRVNFASELPKQSLVFEQRVEALKDAGCVKPTRE